VQPWQIDAWNLATRPTKTTDSRSKGFVGESVEVDPIVPSQLRALITDCIEHHIDQRQLDITKVAEASERSLLSRLSFEDGQFYLLPEDNEQQQGDPQ
jgi:hypothetical protein